jgi:hypothetical protein
MRRARSRTHQVLLDSDASIRGPDVNIDHHLATRTQHLAHRPPGQGICIQLQQEMATHTQICATIQSSKAFLFLSPPRKRLRHILSNQRQIMVFRY